jgi:cytochrome c551
MRRRSSKEFKAESEKQKAESRGISRSLVLYALCFMLFCCQQKTEKEKKDTSTKFQQYYVNGEKHYLKNCSNCHQKNGSGLGLVYPPLNKSDYMEKNLNRVICLIRHGANGELIVNGKTFNQKMHGIPSLTDLEIAEIATYIYNTWEHKHGMIDVSEVASLQHQCK